MDLHWSSDGQLVGAVLVAVANVVAQLARPGRRTRRRQPAAGGLAELVAVMPAGSRVEEVRLDGTVVRVELPAVPATRRER